MINRPMFKRRRHVARSARILSTGISATAILAMTAAYAAAEQVSSATDTGTETVGMAVTMQPVGFSNTGTVQPALAPLGVASTSPAQPAAADSQSVDATQNTTATKAIKSPKSEARTVVAPVETLPPVEPVTPVDTVSPIITIAPEVTVTPITAAPTPVQLEVPKSSNGSTSGGSR